MQKEMNGVNETYQKMMKDLIEFVFLEEYVPLKYQNPKYFIFLMSQFNIYSHNASSTIQVEGQAMTINITAPKTNLSMRFFPTTKAV